MDSDFVITAGGMTTYELVYLGLPMIIISTADNQINLAIAWDRLGVAKYFGPVHDLTQENFDSQFSLFINQMPDYKATDTVDVGERCVSQDQSIITHYLTLNFFSPW